MAGTDRRRGERAVVGGGGRCAARAGGGGGAREHASRASRACDGVGGPCTARTRRASAVRRRRPYRVPWWPLRVSECGPHMYPPPPQRRALRVYTPKDSPPAVHPSTLAHGGERRPEAAVRHGATTRRRGPVRKSCASIFVATTDSRTSSRYGRIALTTMPCARHGARSCLKKISPGLLDPASLLLQSRPAFPRS